MAMQQEPIDWRYRFHIFLAYFLGLCKGIYPQNMVKNMVLTYLHVLDPGDLPLKRCFVPSTCFNMFQRRLLFFSASGRRFSKWGTPSTCPNWNPYRSRPTWGLIPRLVSGLVHPSYKWINPTYPIYNWGYNPLTKWDEPPSSTWVLDPKVQPPHVSSEGTTGSRGNSLIFGIFGELIQGLKRINPQFLRIDFRKLTYGWTNNFILEMEVQLYIGDVVKISQNVARRYMETLYD